MPLVASSSVPAVKAAVLALLNADAALTTAGVQIAWAHPGTGIQKQVIYFYDTDLNEAAVILGRNRRTEDYDLTLIVDYALDGNDAQACEVRGWAMVAEVEAVMRANVDVSAVIQGGWCVISAIGAQTYMDDGGWLFEAKITLHVKNHK